MRAATALALLALAPAAALARPPAIPVTIAAGIAAEQAASGEKYSPARARRAVTTTDIDGDGLRDWAVDWGKFGFASWCGTGGCRYQLWRASADGVPQLVFDNIVRSHAARNAGDEILLDFDFHGSTCGTFGAAECLISFAWDAKAGRMAERVNPKGDGTVRYVEPLEPGMQGYPAAVRAAVEDMIRFCTAQGARPDAASDEALLPASIPDVDGDGQRDWAFVDQGCAFEDGRESITREDALLISAGDPERPVLFAPGGRLEISVATVPASILQIDDKAGGCADRYRQPGQVPCPRIGWRWDGAKREVVRR